MLDAVALVAKELLGLDRSAEELLLRHTLWRALVVFAFAVLLIRVADRRLIGQNAGFDIIVAVIIGSVLSRGVNGDASFFASLAATGLLVALHHVLAAAAFRWHRVSELLKGRAHVLVSGGSVDEAALGRAQITRDDLDENLRLNGNVSRLEEVAEARLERNGAISVVHASNSTTVESQAAPRRRQRSRSVQSVHDQHDAGEENHHERR